MDDKDKLIIAVDFDGVIHRYDKWIDEFTLDKPVKGAREYMRKLVRDGWYVIVYTCRRNLDVVRDFLRTYQIPFHSINHNPYQPEDVGKHKIFAHVYLDDRGLRFINWKNAYSKLKKIRKNELKK